MIINQGKFRWSLLCDTSLKSVNVDDDDDDGEEKYIFVYFSLLYIITYTVTL